MCLAIGVTNRIDNDQMQAFATGPQYVAEVQNFEHLTSSRQMVVNAMQALCGRTNVSIPTRPIGKNKIKTNATTVLSRVHTRTHVAGHKLYPLVAVNMCLVSATKLLPVCRSSVAGYNGIQVDRDINE